MEGMGTCPCAPQPSALSAQRGSQHEIHEPERLSVQGQDAGAWPLPATRSLKSEHLLSDWHQTPFRQIGTKPVRP